MSTFVVFDDEDEQDIDDEEDEDDENFEEEFKIKWQVL
jgi:hypothetical protein